jgi:Ca2+-binding RTX toxin-like protein
MNLLPDILNQVYQQLSLFANGNNFGQVFNTSFGSTYNITASEILRQNWQAGDFSQLPEIEVISSNILGGANGAYASSTNKIYLSDNFVATASSASLQALLLEEIGHYVDAHINIKDSAGDEGAIFSNYVMGATLSKQQLQALKSEDDQASIYINGQNILVEEQNFTGTSGNDNITGTAADDTINSGLGYDSVDGGLGNDLLIVDYSSNTYSGTSSYPAGIGSSVYSNGVGGWNGYISAYNNGSGGYDQVSFSNIESFQVTGTNFNDYFDGGGGGFASIDGGAGIDTINNADFSSFTTGLTIDNSGATITQSNGTYVKNVERFNNLTTGSGNDTITFTGSFSENINTRGGNDTINAGRGQDNVNGGAGNDLLIVDYSSNTYSGTASYTAGLSTSISVSGGVFSGNVFAYNNGSGGYDQVYFSGIERLQLTGTNFNDYFDLNNGLISIDGGAGTDTIGTADFSSVTTGLTIDNSGATITRSNGTYLKNVERFNNLTTGSGNDTITFTGSLNETINTGAGNDTINGGRGQDNVNGGAGNDLLIVDYSSNTYSGTTSYPAGIGSDIYSSGSGGWNGYIDAYNNISGGYDQVNFSNIERFQITGTNFNDNFDEGGGGISIDGGTGTDTINNADFSSDTTGLTINNTGATITQSNGTYVKNVERFNNLWTGSGNDTITFTGSFNDNINTGAGNDTINSAFGDDNVDGGDGNDLLIVNYSGNTYSGNASYPGGIVGSISSNGLGGWNGNIFAHNNSSGGYDQVIFSNIERFQITGTNLNDNFGEVGRFFNIDGGTGTDTVNNVNFSGETTNLTIDNSAAIVTFSNGAVLKNIEQFFNLSTGSGNDTITLTGSFDDSIYTGAGNDIINAGRGRDTVDGGEDDDLLIINYSSNTYSGTTSYPAGIVSHFHFYDIDAGNGYFSAYNNSSGGYDVVNFSNIERFHITGTNLNDSISTGNGDDTILGGTGNDTINGEDGNDIIRGDAGNDTINGGDGDDIIIGVNPTITNPGSTELDNLTGGLGSDRFVLGDYNWIGYDDVNITNAGTGNYALINDFNTYQGDVIQLRGASSNYRLVVAGTDTQILIDKPGTEPDERIALIKNQTTLSLTNSYFSYIPVGVLPSITLAVAPGSVTEDGINNLVYTFTRNGSITSAFTVNYAIAGSATFNTDYTQTGAGSFTGTTGTINFAVGATTATLTIDPTSDIDIETDETVILTLATGTGYTVGTTTAVTGTIVNDDFSNLAPNGLTLSNSNIAENQPVSTVVGNLTGTDPDAGDTLTYSLVTGTGDTDNASFTIVGTQLQTNGVFDFETKNSYNIRVRTTDQGGLFFEQTFTIGITNINEIIGTVNNESFTATSAPDSIDGQGGNDTITSTFANLSNDLFNGNVGTDTLVITGGVAGNAINIDASNVSNQLLNIPGTTIIGFETFNLTSFAGTVNFLGTTGNDIIQSGAGNDTLNGGAGADTLNGGTGADTMIGGLGNDIYTVDNVGDIITENLNEGTDTVNINRTYTLLANFENLTLTGTTAINGTGNELNNSITGNSAANILTGGIGNDTINGGAGADTLIGGVGNDIYTVDNVGDVITENAGEGTDTVNSSITYILGTTLENLTLTGSLAIDGTGNSANNTITGNTGNNTLTGGDGIDTLTGGTGNDILVGGTGADILTGGIGSDIFRFNIANEGLDNIKDFKVAELDIIQVSAAGFGGGLVVGNLDVSQFISGAGITSANSSSQRFIYNTTNGALFYDADGNAVGSSAVQIATLTGLPAINNSHIAIIA